MWTKCNYDWSNKEELEKNNLKYVSQKIDSILSKGILLKHIVMKNVNIL